MGVRGAQTSATTVIPPFPLALSTHTSTNGGPNVAKKVQKNFNNYASVECGAKILGANPEAKVRYAMRHLVDQSKTL